MAIYVLQDVGVWLEEIGLGGYKETFRQNGINGEYLDNLSTFTTEQILRFIRRCHMKWGDFITLCKELRCIKGMLTLPPLKKAFVFHRPCNVLLLHGCNLQVLTELFLHGPC